MDSAERPPLDRHGLHPEARAAGRADRSLLALATWYGLLLAVYLDAAYAVRLAQAYWSLPGLLIPLLEWPLPLLLFVLAALAVTRRRRPRQGEPARPGWHDTVTWRGILACAAYLLLMMILIRSGERLTVYGGARTNDLAPLLLQGERWAANPCAYRWQAPRPGDLVVLRTGRWPDRGLVAAVVVGAPGGTAGPAPVVAGERDVTPPGASRQLASDELAVCATAAGEARVLVRHKAEIRGRVVAVYRPPRGMRSL